MYGKLFPLLSWFFLCFETHYKYLLMQHFIKQHNACFACYSLDKSNNFHYYNNISHYRKILGYLNISFASCLLLPAPPHFIIAVFNCATVCLYDWELLLSHFVLLPSNFGLCVIWSLENGGKMLQIPYRTWKKVPHKTPTKSKSPPSISQGLCNLL